MGGVTAKCGWTQNVILSERAARCEESRLVAVASPERRDPSLTLRMTAWPLPESYRVQRKTVTPSLGWRGRRAEDAQGGQEEHEHR